MLEAPTLRYAPSPRDYRDPCPPSLLFFALPAVPAVGVSLVGPAAHAWSREQEVSLVETVDTDAWTKSAAVEVTPPDTYSRRDTLARALCARVAQDVERFRADMLARVSSADVMVLEDGTTLALRLTAEEARVGLVAVSVPPWKADTEQWTRAHGLKFLRVNKAKKLLLVGV